MKKGKGLKIVIVIIVIVILGLLGFGYFRSQDETEKSQFGQVKSDQTEESQPIDLGNDLTILEIGSYTGMFLEDGTDELVEDVMTIVVKNESDKDLQYTQIYLDYGHAKAQFALTNLKAGASVVVLEQNRMEKPTEELVKAETEHIVFYEEVQNLMGDCFEVEGLEGMMNVKNISEEAISGDVYVYYKNVENGMYFGGITYRVHIEGGIGAGEIKQVGASHYMPDRCEILLVDVVETAE